MHAVFPFLLAVSREEMQRSVWKWGQCWRALAPAASVRLHPTMQRSAGATEWFSASKHSLGAVPDAQKMNLVGAEDRSVERHAEVSSTHRERESWPVHGVVPFPCLPWRYALSIPLLTRCQTQSLTSTDALFSSLLLLFCSSLLYSLPTSTSHSLSFVSCSFLFLTFLHLSSVQPFTLSRLSTHVHYPFSAQANPASNYFDCINLTVFNYTPLSRPIDSNLSNY